MVRMEWMVPRSLDDMPRFLFLDLNQLVGFVVLMSLGMIGGSLAVGCLSGAFFTKAYSRLRRGRHPHFLRHMAYWYLPSWVIHLRNTPPAHQRLYLG